MMVIPAAPMAAERMTASQSGGLTMISGIFIGLVWLEFEMAEAGFLGQFSEARVAPFSRVVVFPEVGDLVEERRVAVLLNGQWVGLHGG